MRRRSGNVKVERGYAKDRQVTLEIAASVKTKAGRSATRMTGNDASTFRTTKKAALAGCSDAPQQTDRVVAVRVRP